VAANAVPLHARKAKSAPLNPLAGFEWAATQRGKGNKGRKGGEKKRKEGDGRYGRKHPQID